VLADPFNIPGCLDIIPAIITNGLVLQAPAVTEIAVFLKDRIIIDFEPNRTFIVFAVKVEVFRGMGRAGQLKQQDEP